MLELKDFEAAADRLKNVIHNIPLSTSCTFSAMTGAEVYLKYENQQKTGSFKVRGAYNKIMKRFAEGDLHAVVASSAGKPCTGRCLCGNRCRCKIHHRYAAVRADRQGFRNPGLRCRGCSGGQHLR